MGVRLNKRSDSGGGKSATVSWRPTVVTRSHASSSCVHIPSRFLDGHCTRGFRFIGAPCFFGFDW
eukprot:5387247-Prorocentrum_lima.AAC.1